MKKFFFLFSYIKIDLMAREKSVCMNNSNLFSFHFSAKLQDLVICKLWRLVICVGVYVVQACDFQCEFLIDYKKLPLEKTRLFPLFLKNCVEFWHYRS